MASRLRLSASSSSGWAEAGLVDRRTGAAGHRLIAGTMLVALVLSGVLLLFQPIANGHQYQLGVRVAGLVSLIWYVGTFRASWLRERWFLLLVFAAGLYVTVQRPLTIRANSEIVAAYGSAFAALDAGRNPYDCGTIVHFDENGEHKLGNFNYPPVELVPYYAVAKLAGQWNHWVLTAVLLLLQLGAGAILFRTFPGTSRALIGAFLPLIACFELHTNVALTLLGVAVATYLLYAPLTLSPRLRQALLMIWFGVVLLTKFLMLAFFATVVLQRVSFRRWRAFLGTASGVGLALAIAALFMLPFGIGNVLRETLLFNLVLSERAKLTTFYPNALSGTLTWLGWGSAFPVLAVLVLAAAVLWSRRLPLLEAAFFTASVFLFVSPTPEPQYIPVLLHLALCAYLHETSRRGERYASAELAARGAS